MNFLKQSRNKYLSVAIDATAYVDGRAPGFNYFLQALLDGIAEVWLDRVKVTLFVRSDQSAAFQRYRTCMNVREVKIENVVRRVIWQNFYFPFVARRFDVILFPGNFAPFFWVRNYLLVVHDLNFLKFPENFSWLAYWFRRINVKRAIRRALHCVAISNQVKHEILNYFHREVLVIHNAVRKPHLVETVEAWRALRDVKYLIIVPASLAVHKNIASAYNAALDFAKKYNDVGFVFFGNWSATDFVNADVVDRIHVLGYVDAELKAWLFSVCNAVMVPSVYEGFGIPYVEALLSGKALICSDIEVAREVVLDYPYYIKAPYGQGEIFSVIEFARVSGFSPKIVDENLLNRYSTSTVAKSYLNLIEGPYVQR